MRHNAYAEECNATRLMLAGLKAHGARMSRWGFNAEFVAALEDLYEQMQRLNNEQQALKSRLKEKTAAVNTTMAAVQKLRKQARHTVKAAIAPRVLAGVRDRGFQVTML